MGGVLSHSSVQHEVRNLNNEQLKSLEIEYHSLLAQGKSEQEAIDILKLMLGHGYLLTHFCSFLL